jgi:transposase InsO family protein
LQHFTAAVAVAIIAERTEHPRWGPTALRLALQQRPELQGERLPSRATMGRYLHQFPAYRRPHVAVVVCASERPPQPPHVHARGQIDFKEDIRLADGTPITLHTIRDPAAGACLAARITVGPPGRSRRPRVTVADLMATCRWAFAHWGTLPEAIQTDNEPVFVGDTGDLFPGQYTQWLVGLGIEHVTIRPATPTDNAEVERCHQTLYNYVFAGQLHRSATELQQALDRAVDQLTLHMPSFAADCANRPPALAHPELYLPLRPWRPEWELAHFDLQRLARYLAARAWVRRVGKNGQVCIGGHHRYYSVGRAHACEDVLVCFDPTDFTYVFFALPNHNLAVIGAELACTPARYLTAAAITGLADPHHRLPPQQLPLPFAHG